MPHPLPPAARRAPHLLRTAAAVAGLGTLALVLGTIAAAMVVPGADWTSDTISDLASGRREWVQDVALYAYAGGLLAAAVGAAHEHEGSRRWSLGILCLLLLALAVVIIGVREEYGDGDSDGVVIHSWLVYALGFLYTALFLAMARGLDRISRAWGRISLGCAALWAVGGIAYFFVPPAIGGAWERALGLVAAVWMLVFVRFLWDAARS
jgi:hypothetical protein